MEGLNSKNKNFIETKNIWQHKFSSQSVIECASENWEKEYQIS